ncbi:MAG TPA: hypothetical protein VI756_11445 [Blastocatellia bacterium]
MTREQHDLMSLDRFLESLYAAGITLSFEKPGKILAAPKGSLSDDQAQALRAWKPYLLRFVQNQPVGHQEYSCLFYCTNDLGSYCLGCRRMVPETSGCVCRSCCNALRLPDGAITLRAIPEQAAEVTK